MNPVRPVLLRWILPLTAIPIFYVLLQTVATRVLGVSLIAGVGVAGDLVLHLLLGAMVLAAARSRWAFLIVMGLLMTLLHLGNAMKIVVLGGPIMPDDMLAAQSLFLILEGLWLAAAVLLAGGIIIALALSVTLRPRRARIAAVSMAAAVAVMMTVPEPVVAALDAQFGNIVWDQHGNYIQRGPLLHMVQESVRYAARAERAPTRAEVLAATELLVPSLQPAALTRPQQDAVKEARSRQGRNVHVIVLESFWDPMELKNAGILTDPFVPEFRTLWDSTNRSRVLSPVFGGYTANAEFEALCGFPVRQDAVFFEGRLRNDVPCLPRVLSEHGYTTVASHPNVAVFWNRVNAYQRVGFDVYWAGDDFAMDDMNGDFLGDASLYRQVMEKVDPLIATGTPTLNYILTFFGHLDYPLNDARPPVIKTANGDERLELYLNTVHYKTRELMDMLADLRIRDPDGLIVIFGDHLPFLGPNHGGYVESGVLASTRGAFTDAMFRTVSATPLIVIDGVNGPQDLGDMPLYHLPAVILDLLGRPAPALMELTRTIPEFAVRPLPGMNVVVGGRDDDAVAACRDPDSAHAICAAADLWIEAVSVLSADLFSGRQHILESGIVPSGRPAGPPVAPVSPGV
ncbi:MAG: LTA synthase family protein [Rhodospirillaceae bacterium]